MHWKRLIALYCCLLFGFWGVLCRLYVLASNTTYAVRAENQTVTTLELQPERGNFFDRNGTPLTGAEQCWYALCIPGESTYTRLFDFVDPRDQQILYQKRNATSPFLVRVDRDLTDEGIFTVSQKQRYPEFPLCPHLIGYLDGEMQGVSGLESAMNEVLDASDAKGRIQCVTNARGGLMQSAEPQYFPASKTAADVQLTVDSGIQAAVEGIGMDMMTSGCIVVLDVETAQVLACASFPAYSQDTVANTIQTGQGSLVNRAFSAYAVGSVFKPLLAAVALEEGLAQHTYQCPGYIDWHNHIYRCAGGVPHGDVDLQTALEKSCNGYFVELGDKIGGKKLLSYAEKLGFGQPVYVTGGMKAAAGNLPSTQTLADAGALANFSFGQGELLATPVQIGAMMNTIAAGGVYRVPSFLLRTFDAATDSTLEAMDTGFQDVPVFSEKTAATLRTMLAGVVADGLGKDANPTWGGAAGKTGTAQTGRFDEEGNEYKNLWFAGFYPAQKPQYTVVVMQDDQIHAEHSSAAVFARVCDALHLLEIEPETAQSTPAETNPEPGTETPAEKG